MASEARSRPSTLRIDSDAANDRLRPSRTRSSRSKSDAQHHAWLKRHFAIPTPLHSPNLSRRQSRADVVGDSPNEERDAEKGNGSVASGGGHFDLELRWRERIKHFTWTWFTMTMATGQMANVIAAVPFRFHGLYTIGLIVMFFNILLFIFNTTCITLRFHLYRSTLWSSLTHPTESLFAPAFVISIGTILMNITSYGLTPLTSSWLEPTMTILFWAYCGLAMASACGIYLIMWSTQTFTISRMTPVWIFPAYPLLVVAPHAAVLAAKIPDHGRALAVVVGGFTLQGIGFMVSLMVYSAFLYRLMTNKLPTESLRPGMFISVGPSGFTVAGVVGLGMEVRKVIPGDFMGVGDMAGVVTMVIANWVGIWLWGLAIFFFIVSVGAHWSCVGSKRMHFAMTWYSFVFPNTGLTTGTFAVGLALKNRPFQILGVVFTVLLVLVWIFVFAMMIRAVHLKQILWPEKQEDRDEGGWMLQKQGSSSSSVHTDDVESTAGASSNDVGTSDETTGPQTSEGPELRLTRASTVIDRAPR